MMTLFVVISSLQYILTYLNNSKKDQQLKNLIDDNKIKDTQLKNLLDNELILRDIKIQLTYDFHLQKELTSKPGPRVMKIGAIMSESMKSLDSGNSNLYFHSGMWVGYIYPNSKTVRLTFDLEPDEKIQNNQIYYLTRFKVLSIPYRWIINNLTEFHQYNILPTTKLKIKFMVNGKIVANCEQSLIGVPLDRHVIITPKTGIFEDIKNTYLNNNPPVNICSPPAYKSRL
jgi:hypothetical protein